MTTFTGAPGNSSEASYTTEYIRRKTIKSLENNLVFADFGTPGELPTGQGQTLRWPIDANLALSQGVTLAALTHDDNAAELLYSNQSPNEAAYNVTHVDAQLNTYGSFIPVRTTDLNKMPEGVMDRMSARLEYRARLDIDTLCRVTLDNNPAGTTLVPDMADTADNTRASIGSGTNNAVVNTTDQLTAEDIALATGDLEALDVEPFSNGMYAAAIHSVPATHLRTDVSTSRLTWESINKHVSGMTGQEKIIKGTIGGITGTMVFRTNNIGQATVNTIANVYHNLVMGQDAFGIASMGDMSPQIIREPVNHPYKMLETIAFRYEMRTIQLDGNRAVLLYSAP